MYGLAARRHPSHPAAEARINRRHDVQARDAEHRAGQSGGKEDLAQSEFRAEIRRATVPEHADHALRCAEQVIDEADGMHGELSKDAARSQPNILQRTDRFVRHHQSSVRNPHHRLQHQAR
jgi:hypothetical protein